MRDGKPLLTLLSHVYLRGVGAREGRHGRHSVDFGRHSRRHGGSSKSMHANLMKVGVCVGRGRRGSVKRCRPTFDASFLGNGTREDAVRVNAPGNTTVQKHTHTVHHYCPHTTLTLLHKSRTRNTLKNARQRALCIWGQNCPNVSILSRILGVNLGVKLLLLVSGTVPAI